MPRKKGKQPPGEWMSVVELAEVLGTDRSNIHYRIKRLLKKGVLKPNQIMKARGQTWLSPKASDAIDQMQPYPVVDEPPIGWIDTGQAAEMFNLKRARLAGWVQKGYLKGVVKKRGSKGFYINPHEVAEMVRDRPGEGWIRTHHARKKYGIPVRTMYRWIEQGRLEAKTWMRERYVREQTLAKLVKQLRKYILKELPPPGWMPAKAVAEQHGVGVKVVRTTARRLGIGYRIYAIGGSRRAYVDSRVKRYMPDFQPRSWVKLVDLIGSRSRSPYAVKRLKAAGVKLEKFLDKNTRSWAWFLRRRDVAIAKQHLPAAWFEDEQFSRSA